MMLGHRKAKPKSSTLVNFLDCADDAYIMAFRAKNIKPFIPYANAEVCNRVLEEINSAELANFGTRRSRIRRWLVQESTDNSVIVLKEIFHKGISLGDGIEIPLADDVKQLWMVSIEQREDFKVVKLETVGGNPYES